MSTWTSKAGAALAACLCLTGCMSGGEFATRGFGLSRSAPETLAVAGRAVVIGGPPGYCVDRGASRDTGDSAFVLLGSCASIVQDARAAAPGVPGILTALVAEPVPDATSVGQAQDALEAFFTSAAGRAALARDGRASSVEVLETRRLNDAFLLRLRDTSAAAMAGTSEDYWRGLLDVNGHLVTVSVIGFAARPLSPQDGYATLTAFLDRIRGATLVRTAGAEEAARTTTPGFLSRLLK